MKPSGKHEHAPALPFPIQQTNNVMIWLTPPHVRTTFGSWGAEKVHAVAARSRCTRQHVKSTSTSLPDHFWRFRCDFASEEDLESWIFRGRRDTKKKFSRDIRRPWCWFSEKGYVLEHQIFRFAEMILLRFSTSYELASLYRGKGRNQHRWSGKNGKKLWHHVVSCTRLSIFEENLAGLLPFWRCPVQKLRNE